MQTAFNKLLLQELEVNIELKLNIVLKCGGKSGNSRRSPATALSLKFASKLYIWDLKIL